MTEQLKFRWIEGKEPTPAIYTNFLHTSWTLFDVRFQLGQLIPIEPGESTAFAVRNQGSVSLAWPAAKHLRDTLIDLIDRYEKTNGEIKPLNLVPAPEQPAVAPIEPVATVASSEPAKPPKPLTR